MKQRPSPRTSVCRSKTLSARVRAFAEKLLLRHERRFEARRGLELVFAAFRIRSAAPSYVRNEVFAPRIELGLHVSRALTMQLVHVTRVSNQTTSAAGTAVAVREQVIERVFRQSQRLERTETQLTRVLRTTLSSPAAQASEPRAELGTSSLPTIAHARSHATPSILANAERHPGIRLPQHLVAEEASARQSTSRGPLEGARRPLATHEVEEVAEKVMTILDRRIVAQRERRGKRS